LKKEGFFLAENHILEKIIATSGDEFYTPIPQGYKVGKTKYVVITGSVMSGIGKGTISSSLCHLLQYYGLNVEPIKDTSAKEATGPGPQAETKLPAN